MSVMPNPILMSEHTSAFHVVSLCCCLLVVIAGCSGEGRQKEQVSGSVGSGSAPLLVLKRMPGNPGPDEPVVSGVVAKLWDDGLLLLSTDPDKPSSNYYLGTIRKEDFTELLRDIDEIASAEANDSNGLIQDAPFLELKVERGVARRIFAESVPLAPNTSIARIRDHLFRIQLTDSQIVNNPESIR